MKKTALRTTAGPPTNPIQGTGTNMHTIALTTATEQRHMIADTRRIRVETIISNSDLRWPYAIANVSLTGEECTGVELTLDQVHELIDVLQVAAEHLRANTPVELFPL